MILGCTCSIRLLLFQQMELISVDVPANPPNSFWCMESTIELASKGQASLEIDFLPLLPGQRNCGILFTCPKVGEFLQVPSYLFCHVYNVHVKCIYAIYTLYIMHVQDISYTLYIMHVQDISYILYNIHIVCCIMCVSFKERKKQ